MDGFVWFTDAGKLWRQTRNLPYSPLNLANGLGFLKSPLGSGPLWTCSDPVLGSVWNSLPACDSSLSAYSLSCSHNSFLTVARNSKLSKSFICTKENTEMLLAGHSDHKEVCITPPNLSRWVFSHPSCWEESWSRRGQKISKIISC